jgi:hypothetical protein
MEVERIPLRRALDMVASREKEDAKTIIGLFLAAQRLGLQPAGGGEEITR